MKTEILEFLLRATFIWSALLGYYFLVLHRNDDWRLRRGFLLFAWGAGLLIPLLPALNVGPEIPTLRFVIPGEVRAAAAEPVVGLTGAGRGWTTSSLLFGGYLLGLVIFLARTLVQSLRVWQWIVRGESSVWGGVKVVRHPGIRSPFAGWGRVFLSGEEQDPELEYIALVHETAHLRRRHHYDTFLMMIGRIVCWFHPLQWVFSRLLSDLHEYEADAAVTELVPVRTYGLHLLQSSLAPTGALGLFSSPLKKRIMMMTKTKVRRRLRGLPLVGLILLLFGLVVACSDATEEVLGEKIALDYPNEETLPVFTLPHGDAGGDFNHEALMRKVYEEIRYPLTARQQGLTGAVMVDLTVGANGEILNLITIRTEPAELPEKQYFVIVGYGDGTKQAAEMSYSGFSEEVNRTLNTILPFEVITQDGAPIPYRLSLGFKFLLED